MAPWTGAIRWAWHRLIIVATSSVQTETVACRAPVQDRRPFRSLKRQSRLTIGPYLNAALATWNTGEYDQESTVTFVKSATQACGWTKPCTEGASARRFRSWHTKVAGDASA